MNIFLRELKANRKSLIFWSIGIFFMIAGGMGKYSAYVESGQDVMAIFQQLPKALLAIMGIGNLNLATAAGFYGLLFVYLLLMAGIHASMLGASIIAKEERDKTTEFLFVKPASRKRIITAKIIAAFTNVLAYNLITLILSVGFIMKMAPDENLTNDILLMMLGMFLFQLAFLAIGTGMAAMTKKPRGAASGAAGVLLTTYLIYALINASGKIDWLKYFTPFKYFEAELIIADKALDPIFVLLSLFIVLSCTAVTYLFYQKKDLNV